MPLSRLNRYYKVTGLNAITPSLAYILVICETLLVRKRPIWWSLNYWALFSDNELSPECLDGVYASVKESAISIPQSYSSYLHPMSSGKLYAEVFAMRPMCPDKPEHFPFELNYVVYAKNAYLLGDPQIAFTFHHNDLTARPNTRDNRRHAKLSWTAPVDFLCHGFIGYFHCVLYKNITLTTLPGCPTPGMFSWFPIYFPVNEAMFVKAGENVTFDVWRLGDKSSVWYEWCLSSPNVGPIHNTKGRSFPIGLH